MDTNEVFWQKQFEIYNKQPYDPAIRYESWQPSRWAANRATIQLLLPLLNGVETICEVGAGSAAFSLEMQKQAGFHVICVDRCKSAKQYAERVAKDMGLCIDYRQEDLFTSDAKADMVLSLGVIEHFNLEMQCKFLQKCREMSRRYILIAIPNQESPVFQNYVSWASGKSQSYEEKHFPMSSADLVRLCEDNEMRVLHVDGFQVFLSEYQFWAETRPDAIPLYQKIKKQLIREDTKWKDFPFIGFSYDDIPIMVWSESSLEVEERLSYGFMTYVLAERIG